MIVSSYSCIDASTGEYQEEEGFYPEEEENFDHLNNQGKLTPLQALWLQANILASWPSAKLYKSKAPLPSTLCLMILSQVFTLQVFDFGLSKLTFWFMIHLV